MTVEAAVREYVSDQRISEIKHVVSEVEFVPKGFEQPVRVRVFRYSASVEMPYFFKTSHFPQTPIQAAPHMVDDPWAETAAEAARMAVDAILESLEEATRVGHTPSDEWLVENSTWTYDRT